MRVSVTDSQSPDQFDSQKLPTEPASEAGNAPLEPEIGPACDAELTVPSHTLDHSREFAWSRFVGLLVAALFASLAVLPYSWTFLKQAKALDLPEVLVPIALAIGVCIELVLSAGAIYIGLALGPKVGLGAMLVAEPESLLGKRASRLWRTIGEPLCLGLVLGMTIGGFGWALDSGAPEKAQSLVLPSSWEGLLASFGAGIREEIWLRFGLMTLLVWLIDALARRTRGPSISESTAAYHAANVLAALGFAAIHIPQAKLLIGLSGPILALILLGNGVPGFVFGWLYWRRGLIPAMLGHLGLDLVLKVALPLLS
jgi:hypothetical protein